jgi:hypothetical protein
MAKTNGTNRAEQSELLNPYPEEDTGVQAPETSGDETVRYDIFLTDGFQGPVGKGNARGHVYIDDTTGAPATIDGFRNDDSYRRSNHHLRRHNVDDIAAAGTYDLAEISLARQVQDKEEQPAIIRLIRRLSKEEVQQKIDNTSSGESFVPWENLIPPNTKFFLENVQESRSEKVQVIDTFGEWIAFFFGSRPEVYTYSGTLINSKNHDWKNEFQFNYDYFLRGTKAVQNRATMMLQYDDVMVEGYMMNSSIQMTAANDKSVPFSFSMLIMNRSNMNPRQLLARRFFRSGYGASELDVFNDLQQSLDLTSNNIEEMQTFLLMREYFSGNYVGAAGKLVHRPSTNNVESDSTVKPGEIGGSSNEKPEAQEFTPSLTNSLGVSGVQLNSYRLPPELD